MKLAHADELVVDREKVVDYLLSFTHRYGASKARFFAAFGFRVQDIVTVLAAQVRPLNRRDLAHTRELASA